MADYTVVLRVWHQTSPEYDSEPATHTLACNGSTTVSEIMAWAKRQGGLGAGDVIISRPETLPAAVAAIEKENTND